MLDEDGQADIRELITEHANQDDRDTLYFQPKNHVDISLNRFIQTAPEQVINFVLQTKALFRVTAGGQLEMLLDIDSISRAERDSGRFAWIGLLPEVKNRNSPFSMGDMKPFLDELTEIIREFHGRKP